jgi:uncharacterized protein (UPF0212 family)
VSCNDLNELTANALLLAWEDGARADPVRRALLLLRAGRPDVAEEEWVNASIGERDRALLRLRERWFGNELQTVTRCPRCGERLESAFPTSYLDHGSRVDPVPTRAPMLGMEEHGYEIRFRLPTSADLSCYLAVDPAQRTPLILLQRCVASVRHEGCTMAVDELPDELIDALADQIERSDPAVLTQVELACPACNDRWQALFDIAAHLWGDVDDWAHHLLDEVHRLAKAYGWSEAEILRMHAVRRHQYLLRVQE